MWEIYGVCRDYEHRMRNSRKKRNQRKGCVGSVMTAEETEKSMDHVNDQYKRLNKAFRGRFYLEAVFIEYMLMDDYMEMILTATDLWQSYLKKRRGHEPALDSKIRYIRTEAVNSRTVVKKYFGDDLLDRILAWKVKRCKLMMASVKQYLAAEYVQSIAEEGKELTSLMRRRCMSVRKASNK